MLNTSFQQSSPYFHLSGKNLCAEVKVCKKLTHNYKRVTIKPQDGVSYILETLITVPISWCINPIQCFTFSSLFLDYRL
jgi:hypothetical protein